MVEWVREPGPGLQMKRWRVPVSPLLTDPTPHSEAKGLWAACVIKREDPQRQALGWC